MGILFEAVLPIFAVILCGFLAGRLSLLPYSGSSSLNYFVYYFALPALLFSSLAQAPVEQLANRNFLLANLFTLLGCFLLTVLIFRFIFKRRFPEVTMYGMITTYGNTGFLGIPLLVALFGQEAAVPAAIVTFIYDLTIITLVVLSFESAKKLTDSQENGTMLRSIVRSILLNPINASLLAGILVAVSGLPIPSPVFMFTDILGPAAGPAALFSLGLGLSAERQVLKNKHYHIGEFLTLLTLKLLALPLLAAVAVYFIFPVADPQWAASIVILSALPTGAVVYVFAEKYNTLVNQVPFYTLATTAVSIISLSVFLMLLIG
ncbi:AEC family transporter [Virgibacillus xinjiangensis]|uniref:AEC family transporter n=1 Tax=Virgibacillus xinjiangensis TaxID=393090 RepID=A0ABV7CY23_9BACI